MKNRFFALLMIAALLLPVLAGCGQTQPQQGDAGVRGSSAALPQHQVSAAPQTKVPESTQETVPATTPPTEVPKTVTREEAEAIALNYVGFAPENVTRLRAEYDVDDGVPHYDIEFYKDGWEYDFEIHAETGTILTHDKEYHARTQEAPAATEPPATIPPTEAPKTLTREEAEAIALNYVGFAPENVTRLRAEYDVDDGVPHYDIEFYKDGWEYDFEIHAETGAILSYEKDD